MDFEKSKKFLVQLGLIYWILVIMIYVAAGSQFKYILSTSDTLSASSVIGELVDGETVTEKLTSPANSVSTIDVMTVTYGRKNNCTINFELSNESGEIVANQSVACSDIQDNTYTTVNLNQLKEVNCGETLTLSITSFGATSGNAIGLYYGNSVTSGRLDIVKNIDQNEYYQINGETGLGSLCVKVSGIKYINFYKTYWLITISLFVILVLYTCYGFKQAKKGKNSYVVAICMLHNKYSFLLKQLVSRDFKTKYKRSVLGMAWSFINPLLTMSVQYIVFSTIFKSDTLNYPVYLLTGVVFYNFFTEAVNQGLISITSNAALIKKVYVPKYIYPTSKLFSSLINLGLSLIPLVLVMIITGTQFKISLLLLIFDIICLSMFVLGMMLLLATSMTFFQDTQFLWGVVSMIWMYFTPLFYTENIIPSKMLTFFHMNPMYQYITFARTCIISGISPEPISYLWCLISAIVVLAIGLYVFKKNQDKFVLYI